MKVIEKVKRGSGIEEEVCEHGVGHPTLESAKKVAKARKHELIIWLSHGCDGCCCI